MFNFTHTHTHTHTQSTNSDLNRPYTLTLLEWSTSAPYHGVGNLIFMTSQPRINVYGFKFVTMALVVVQNQKSIQLGSYITYAPAPSAR